MNKKESGFVHLHVHSEYSLLDGLESCESLINRAKELSMDTLAVTDHGTMRGLVSFYETARKNGINTVLGQEFYFRPNRHEKKHKSNENYHTTILIKNLAGWKNCINLTTEANLTGYYYKPRIDLSLLEKHSEGLMLGSGCIGSMTNWLIKNNHPEKARVIFDQYINFFGDDFYIELTTDSQPDQKIINDFLLRYAKDNGIVYTIMSDVHWASKEDFKYHDVLLSLQVRKKLNDPDRFRFPTKDTWMKSEDEMWEFYFENCTEYMSEDDFFNAMANTRKISDKCNEVFLDEYYDHYRMPDTKMDDAFETIWIRATSNRLDYMSKLSSEEKRTYNERLRREINLIVDQGFSDYFIMTADLTDYMKEENIMKGLARGSAGGSLLAFMLGITEIDPIIHNLSFERFMNENKKSMPDIDIDIDDEKRQFILDYFIEKYGNENVAQIGTYVALQEKSALKDVAWSLDMPYDSVNTITKKIDGFEYPSLSKMTEEEFTTFKKDPEVGTKFIELTRNFPEWLNTSEKIKGVPKAIGKHPAGIVVGDESLRNLVPLQKAKGDGNYVTEWIDGTYRKELTETLKLVKFDLLGLSNLGIMQDIITLIRERNESSDKLDLSLPDTEILSSIPLDDSKIFSLFPLKLIGIFQFDTNAVHKILEHVLPRNLTELCALNSLNRPATKELTELYAKNRKKKNVSYAHPIMKEVLNETYGIMLYQDQVMELANKLGGIPLSEADDFRKALVKYTESNKEQQEELRKTILERFVKGAVINGLEEDKAIVLSERMAKFAGYGFNKSHSRAYSILSYYTLYLKYYFESEFYTAYLNKRVENLPQVTAEVGIEKFLPVDINLSSEGYKLEGDKIRVGFSGVKSLGTSAINEIIKNQPYSSREDLLLRCNKSKCNKTRINALIKVGAFHNFGEGNISNMENEMLMLGTPDRGVAIRYNKIEYLRKAIKMVKLDETYGYTYVKDLNNIPLESDHVCTVVGCITDFTEKSWNTKRGGFLKGFIGEITDETGSCRFIRWQRDKDNDNIRLGSIVLLIGRLKKWSGRLQFNIPSTREFNSSYKHLNTTHAVNKLDMYLN